MKNKDMKHKEIPSSVSINGMPYAIELTKDVFDGGNFGMINHADQIIYINADMKTQQKMCTLCHEVVHGMLLSIGRTDLSADETFVQSLAVAIYNTDLFNSANSKER